MLLIEDKSPRLPTWVAAHINRRVMTDFAFREAFDVDERDLEIEDVLHAAVQSLAILKKDRLSDTIPALGLKSAVAKARKVSRPIAEKSIEKSRKIGHLDRLGDFHDRRKKHYRLTVEARTGLERYEELLTEISKVVEAQKADPANPTAGIDQISSEYVYFNVNDPDVVRAAHKQMLEWMEEVRETSR